MTSQPPTRKTTDPPPGGRPPAGKPKTTAPASKMPAPPKQPAPSVAPKRTQKTFKVRSGDSTPKGKKIIIYADTGMGKTTLASMAPNPMFIDPDNGCDELKHPITGEDLNERCIEGIETFMDIRDVLSQYDLIDGYETVVIDNATVLQDLAEPHVFATVPGPNNSTVTNITGYGFNKGYKHLYDAMKSVLADCDALINRGKNVIIIAQSISNRVSNPGGDDFLRDGPRLYAGKPSIESLYCEWASHIFRIDYADMWVKDRKITGETTRVVYTQPEVHFRAKSRTLKDAVISFDKPADDSLWTFLFKEN